MSHRILKAADHRRMPWKNGRGETVEIAVQTLVLAHDLARGLDNAVETLGSGQLLRRSLLSGGCSQDRAPSIPAV